MIFCCTQVYPPQNSSFRIELRNTHAYSSTDAPFFFQRHHYIPHINTAHLYTKLAASAREEVDDGDSKLASMLTLSSSPAAPLPELSLLKRLRLHSAPTPPLPNRPTLPQRPVLPLVSGNTVTVTGERELSGSGEAVTRR